jgi:hypothetical protein
MVADVFGPRTLMSRRVKRTRDLMPVALPSIVMRPVRLRIDGDCVKFGNQRLDIRLSPVLDEVAWARKSDVILDFLIEHSNSVEVLSVLRPPVLIRCEPASSRCSLVGNPEIWWLARDVAERGARVTMWAFLVTSEAGWVGDTDDFAMLLLAWGAGLGALPSRGLIGRLIRSRLASRPSSSAAAAILGVTRQALGPRRGPAVPRGQHGDP